MNLDEAKKQRVAAWIAEGLKLSEIQKRLDVELGLKLTYMEVRLLMNELALSPKDQPRSAPVNPLGTPPSSSLADAPPSAPPAAAGVGSPPPGPGVSGRVSVTVDALACPGAVASGRVTFSDGQEAAWYLDQAGRLGLSAKQKDYRPSPEDVQAFQTALETELSRAGL